jgi:hypothetical protein
MDVSEKRIAAEFGATVIARSDDRATTTHRRPRFVEIAFVVAVSTIEAVSKLPDHHPPITISRIAIPQYKQSLDFPKPRLCHILKY